MYQPMTLHASILPTGRPFASGRCQAAMHHHILHVARVLQYQHGKITGILIPAGVGLYVQHRRAPICGIPLCPSLRFQVSVLSTDFVYQLHGFRSPTGCHNHSAERLRHSYAR